MTELKVFGMCIASYSKDEVFKYYTDEQYLRSRQLEAVVATKTKKEAAQLFGVTYNYFSEYAGETGNERQIAAAMSNPGVVMARPLNVYGNDAPYFPVYREPHIIRPRRKKKPLDLTITKPYFTNKDLLMIEQRFAMSNDPEGVEIARKCRIMLGIKEGIYHE